MEKLRELEYFQSLYPGRVRHLQNYVIAACDQLDYDYSPMYDEYPDRVMVNQMCTSICNQIMEDPNPRLELQGLLASGEEISGRQSEEITGEGEGDISEPETDEEEMVHQLEARHPWGPPPPRPPWGPPPPRPPWGPPPPRPPWGPPPPRPPWGPPPRPPKNPGWLDDVVRILLLNEMHRRRCQRGICR